MTNDSKPKTLKEAIILVLQEAGPGGLTAKEMVQRIKKKKWWDWKNERSGYDSVSNTCRYPSNGDVFVRVAPGTYALWALQDDDFTPYEKPKTLKEAIILVLQEAGPGGLTAKEMVQRIKKKKWWDWNNERSGYDSVSNTCRNPSNGDVFVRVAPGTYALWALQDDDFTPYEKPMTLKEAIILVLQEAGPGGLTAKEMVQRIKKKKWWDWKNERSGYNSVSVTCREPSNGDVFVCVAPGVYALWALQDDDFTPYVKPAKPMTLKEAIILVLQEAGPEGLTLKEIVQRIKKKFSWHWENESSGSGSVSDACRNNRDVFVKHSRGVYALRSLQEGVEEGEGTSKVLTKEKPRDAERTATGAKRAREAADGSADELSERTVKKKNQVLEEPKSDVVPVEDRRISLYSNAEEEAIEWLEHDLEQPCGEKSADRRNVVRKGSSSERENEERSFSDLTGIPLANYTVSELKAIADAANKRIEILSKEAKKKQNAEKLIEESQSDAVPVEDRRLLLFTNEQKEAADACLEHALEEARKERTAGRPKEIGKASSSEKERSFSDSSAITVAAGCMMSALHTVADAERKRLGMLSKEEKEKKKIIAMESAQEPQSHQVPVNEKKIPLYMREYLDQEALLLQQALDLLTDDEKGGKRGRSSKAIS